MQTVQHNLQQLMHACIGSRNELGGWVAAGYVDAVTYLQMHASAELSV